MLPPLVLARLIIHGETVVAARNNQEDEEQRRTARVMFRDPNPHPPKNGRANKSVMGETWQRP